MSEQNQTDGAQQPGAAHTEVEGPIEEAPLTKAPKRPKYAPPSGPRPPGSAMAVEKSLNFGPSLKRLLGHLAPERRRNR